MNTIRMDFQEFLNISLEDCLNYYPDTKLENLIETKIESIVKSTKSNKYQDLSNTEKLMTCLKRTLLQVTTNKVWIETRDSNDLGQEYLYTVIKKYIYILS